MNRLNKNNTATALRLLAKQLDDDSKDTPDFLICLAFNTEPVTYQSTHRALSDPYTLLGIMREQEHDIMHEIELNP